MEAVSLGEDVASDWLRISHNFASILLRNGHDFRLKKTHDRATIGPRSGRDRGAIEVLVSCRSFSNRLETIASRKLHDRGSIVRRLRFDQTAIVEFFHEASLPSDGLQLDEQSRFTDPVRRDQDSSPPPAVQS